MKILYFSTTYSPVTHGPALTAQIIANIPENDSFEVRMVSESFVFNKPPKAYLIDISIFRIFHAWGKWIRMWIYFKKAKEIYKDYAFDYLVFNDALLGFFSAIIWRKTSIKIWGFCNDSAYMNLTSNVNKWRLSFLMEGLHTLAEYGMMHLSDGIFTCSQYLRTHAIAAYGVNEKRIKCLYPGISFSFWMFKLRDYKHDEILEEILFVKGDYKNGGLSVLLKALNRLNKYTFRLHIAGIPAAQETKLKKLLKKYPLLDIISYGQISPCKVRELMYQCDTLCVPSINEGFGIINIEGLATGISVVTTQTGGIPEVFPMDKYGWTTPPADDVALAEALAHCWMNSKERVRRALAGRKMVENNFSNLLLQQNFIKCLISE